MPCSSLQRDVALGLLTVDYGLHTGADTASKTTHSWLFGPVSAVTILADRFHRLRQYRIQLPHGPVA